MTTPPLHNTDDQSMICTECNYRCETPSEYHPYWYCILAKAGQLDIAKSAILSLLAEARTQTAETILHRGYCIPEMETQVEDYIAALRQKESKDGRS